MKAVSVTQDIPEVDARLTLAKALIVSLESGDVDETNRVLSRLTETKDSHLFDEIGKLARNLHNSVCCYIEDQRIDELICNDLPSTQEKLNFIIEETESSAHRTLNNVEGIIGMLEIIETESVRLQNKWNNSSNENESSDMKAEFNAYLEKINFNCAKSKDDLEDIILAQEYQDLTGQIIKQVIQVVKNTENQLIDIIQHFGVKENKTDPVNKEEKNKAAKIIQTGSDTLHKQDEVDDLLSSYGF